MLPIAANTICVLVRIRADPANILDPFLIKTFSLSQSEHCTQLHCWLLFRCQRSAMRARLGGALPAQMPGNGSKLLLLRSHLHQVCAVLCRRARYTRMCRWTAVQRGNRSLRLSSICRLCGQSLRASEQSQEHCVHCQQIALRQVLHMRRWSAHKPDLLRRPAVQCGLQLL